MTTCCYCGRIWKEENECCAYCGAPSKKNKIAKYDPFFYEGYIVYAIRDWSMDVYKFIFYKGITCMGTVVFTFDYVESLPPAIDYMPLVFERLQVGSYD